jgi:hypothetical protein
MGENGTSNHNTHLSTGAHLQLALNKMMALTGELNYYRFRFDNAYGLPDGVHQRFDRRSARIGLNLWLPLFR